MRSGTASEDEVEKGLMTFESLGEAVLSYCWLLLLTDSANCYASLLRGKPCTVEKCVRIQSSYLRDLLDAIALTFIDKDSIWQIHRLKTAAVII